MTAFYLLQYKYVVNSDSFLHIYDNSTAKRETLNTKGFNFHRDYKIDDSL